MAAAAQTFAFDAFEANPDPVALLAPDGAVLRANSAFRAAFRHWIGPNRAPWGRTQPPAFVDGVRRFDAPAPDGRLLEWVERVLPDGVRFVSARDVSARVDAAETAARAKTILFATLTHELRTPLNGVLGMAGLLAEEALAPAAHSYVAAIRQSGEHLLDIITEILDYSRLEAGAILLESAPFDPEATLQSVAELLSPKAHAKGVEVAVLARAGAPNWVLGDDGRLRQILFNLAGNAVKFVETGGVALEVSAANEGRVRFVVRDTGPGVPPEFQAHIFEEFAQADASIAQRHGGAGLGLAIVKRLAAAMGGKVGLTSRIGEGAAFWVDLPLPNAPGGVAAPRLEGLSIAVASPSRFYARVLATALDAMGARVARAGDKADVVLIDSIDSFAREEVDALRAATRAAIALVPQEGRDAIARARALGVAHYLIKPVRRRSLVEQVRQALSRQEQAAPAESGTLAGLRVLLAEDNPVNALLARTLLARLGCTVDVVGDGAEAIAAASAGAYDLIFLDLRMPRVDGLQAARRIRALDGPVAATPLVALTADAADADRARARAAGFDDFVTKPIDAAHLHATAARFTRKAKPSTV